MFGLLVTLTISLPIPLRLCTLPYWYNPPLLIFDVRALWCSGLSARAPECKKLKMVGYTSIGTGRFEQQQFGTASVEGVNNFAQFTLVSECTKIENLAKFPKQFVEYHVKLLDVHTDGKADKQPKNMTS